MLWLLGIISLPTENATARVRIWRALKALGCASLRDGVWLLPDLPQPRRALATVTEEARNAGGEAWLLTVSADSAQAEFFPHLFDRGEDYATLLDELGQFDPLADEVASARKQMKIINKRFMAALEIDYFPHPLQRAVRTRLQAAEAALQQRLQVAEPAFQAGEPHRLRLADFQGRFWATRHNLWIDRLASAWLIRRYIDPQARFLWLAEVTDCPPDALGFDFDGAAFTHTGRYVTFETLLVSFGLEQDAGLQRLGKLVHTLDVGGNAPEAAGFLPVLQGLKRRYPEDDALLQAGSPLLDDLYHAFSLQES